MEIISFVYFLIFIIGAVIILTKTNQKKENIKNKKYSIIIPFRNELNYLKDNLNSLIDQTYDKKKYELIYVNDHSTDGGDRYIKGENVKLINLKKSKGKFEAIKKGVKSAKYQNIILTDADCTYSSKYIETVNTQFQNTTLLAGFFYFKSKFYSLDAFLLIAIASILNKLNIGTSCPGANICIKKDSYLSFINDNNYKKNKLTEDAMLINYIKSKKNNKVKFLYEPKGVIRTRGYNNIIDFFRQRLRWLKGGYNLSISLLIFLVCMFVSHILFIINIKYLFVPFISILIFLFVVTNRLKKSTVLYMYLVYFIYFIFYTIIIGILFLFKNKKIKWKGREYE